MKKCVWIEPKGIGGGYSVMTANCFDGERRGNGWEAFDGTKEQCHIIKTAFVQVGHIDLGSN